MRLIGRYVAFLSCSLATLACGEDGAGKQQLPAASGAALKVDYVGNTDVVGFAFTATPVPCPGVVTPVTGTPVKAVANLQDNRTWGAISTVSGGPSTTSGHLLANVVLTLAPGCWDLTATPAKTVDLATGEFTPSLQCGVAMRSQIAVLSGQTTTVDPPLVSQCAGTPGPGNLDGRVALNHPPIVTVRINDSIGFQCEWLEACAFLADPDGDPLATEWTEVAGSMQPLFQSVDAMPVLIGQSGGMKRYRQCARFAFPTYGKRDFQVVVRDLLNDGTPIEAALPMGTTSRASMTFSLTNTAGFEPQCLEGTTLKLRDPGLSVSRAPGCMWQPQEAFYCNAANATTFGFDLASTCPGGTFAPAAVYPSCTIDAGPTSDADNDGIADAFDQCPGTAPGASVNANGCAASQLAPERNTEPFPPYGLMFTRVGDPGRAGGVSWGYGAINRAGHTAIYWVLNDAQEFGPYGVSLDGPVLAPEAWTLSAGESNLPGGVAVFRNATNIRLFNNTLVPLVGRLTVTASTGSMPIPFQPVMAFGITPEQGTLAIEVPGTTFSVHAIVEVSANGGMTWTPYLAYYDAAQTPPEAKEAFISLGGSFYDK